MQYNSRGLCPTDAVLLYWYAGPSEYEVVGPLTELEVRGGIGQGNTFVRMRRKLRYTVDAQHNTHVERFLQELDRIRLSLLSRTKAEPKLVVVPRVHLGGPLLWPAYAMEIGYGMYLSDALIVQADKPYVEDEVMFVPLTYTTIDVSSLPKALVETARVSPV